MKSGYFQITRKCNNNCLFCSNPKFDTDFSWETLKNELDLLLKENVHEILFTGGEPTLSEYLFDCIAYVSEKDPSVELKMITNGSLFSDKNLARKLYETPLKNIHVSIQTHIKEDAILLSKNDDYFEESFNGLHNLSNAGFNVNLNTTLNSVNTKYLSEFISFMVTNFPSINHFVFNGLDPGFADMRLKSKAGENTWILPRFVDMELELYKTMNFLKKNGKSFRIERVPLCYLQGFEEYNTEARKNVKEKGYFLSVARDSNYERRDVPCDARREKMIVCDSCFLNDICGGIQKEYLDIYRSEEIFPSFENKKKIIEKILDKK